MRGPMRRSTSGLLVAATAAGALLAGCGGGDSTADEATTSTAARTANLVKAGMAPPRGCYVTVFLSENVTAAQREHVQGRLLSNPRVLEVAFVPKKLSLRRFARANPLIAAGMRLNLFPDKFEARLISRLSALTVVTDFAAGVDGITNAKASAACAKP
jgi:FtsX-like permease family protein